MYLLFELIFTQLLQGHLVYPSRRDNRTKMKFIIPFIAALLLSLTFVSGISAANLDGHMQYRIISYSLNADTAEDPKKNVNLGPFLITGLTSEALREDFTDEVNFSGDDSQSTTNVFGVSADYFATPDLALYGAFGITKSSGSSAFDEEYEASWEANVGVIYKLFNNIRYEVHFGYMDTGDLFRESNTYTDVESIIMISNKLSMSF